MHFPFAIGPGKISLEIGDLWAWPAISAANLAACCESGTKLLAALARADGEGWGGAILERGERVGGRASTRIQPALLDMHI